MHALTSGLWMLMAILVTGCAGAPRKDALRFGSDSALPVGFPSTVRIVDDTRHAFETRAPRILEQVHAAAEGGPINVLALSGGGAGAAYGAGALVGWTRQGTRPDFQIVTGVSAGALMAPFAFIGSSWDEELADAYSGGRTQHLFQGNWMRALFGASVYRGTPLVDLVDRYVTDKLLRAVAAEAAKGRLLMIATTDLDKEQTVIWNLGVIAAQGGDSARRLFRDVIVASASIPGLFPPVIIHVEESGTVYDEMHVDGGTTSPLFIAPEIASVLQVDAPFLHGANVYIVENGQFGALTQTTPIRTIPILKRSITAALQSSSLAAVEIALSMAERNGMRVRVTAIPNGYPFLGSLNVEPARMKALFDFGVQCAIENKLWVTPVDLIDHVERARVTPSSGPPACPVEVTKTPGP